MAITALTAAITRALLVVAPSRSIYLVPFTMLVELAPVAFCASMITDVMQNRMAV